MTTNFFMSIHLPAKQDEAPKEQVDRIFAALIENDIFKTRLTGFISELRQDY